MTTDYGKELLHKYFFRRLCLLDDEERKIISAMRTKTGLVILCDKLRHIEIEKQVIQGVYEELKYFY